MSQTALTYRDYEALPPDGSRYEIHDGDLSVTLAPTPRHLRGHFGAPTNKRTVSVAVAGRTAVLPGS